MGESEIIATVHVSFVRKRKLSSRRQNRNSTDIKQAKTKKTPLTSLDYVLVFWCFLTSTHGLESESAIVRIAFAFRKTFGVAWTSFRVLRNIRSCSSMFSLLTFSISDQYVQSYSNHSMTQTSTVFFVCRFVDCQISSMSSS